MNKIAIAAAVMLASGTASAETFAIQAGRVIVDAAKPARGPSTVIVDNGRVVRIEDGATAPAGATVVDMRSRTVMPGLIDVHVHLTSNSGEPWYQALTPKYSEPYAATVGLTNALVMARAGFTTVRDLGGPALASLAMRDAIARGQLSRAARFGVGSGAVDHRRSWRCHGRPQSRAWRGDQRGAAAIRGLHRGRAVQRGGSQDRRARGRRDQVSCHWRGARSGRDGA